MAAPSLPLPFGRYLLVERIAVGGMAEIFKATLRGGPGQEKALEKTLVVKRILPELAADPEFVTMLQDEARLTIRLNHVNIVAVSDFGREGQDHYLAMDYVPGVNLRTLLTAAKKAGGPMLPISVACYIALQVARGLAYAHSQIDEQGKSLGIIHRDVTPMNILLSWEGEVKVADFGIAKAATRSSADTKAGFVKGKAAYLAPEQLGESGFDARADVFALGACLWEMLAGRRMVEGNSDFEMMTRLMADEPFPSPAYIRTGLPPAVDDVVMKAVARHPVDRYPDAASFQADLSTLVAETKGSASQLASLLRRLFPVSASDAPPAEIVAENRSLQPAPPPPEILERKLPAFTPVTAASEAIPVPRGSGPVATPPSRPVMPAPSPSRSSKRVAPPAPKRSPPLGLLAGAAGLLVVLVVVVMSLRGSPVPILPATQAALDKAAAAADPESAENTLFFARLQDGSSEVLTWNLWRYSSRAGSDHAPRYATEYLEGYNGNFTPERAHAEEIRTWQAAAPLAGQTNAGQATATPAQAVPVAYPAEVQQALDDAQREALAGDQKAAEGTLVKARFGNRHAEILSYMAWKYGSQAAGNGAQAEKLGDEYLSGFGKQFVPAPEHVREITDWRRQADGK